MTEDQLEQETLGWVAEAGYRGCCADQAETLSAEWDS